MRRRIAKKLCLTLVMSACIAVLCVTASSPALTDFSAGETAGEDASDQPAVVVIPEPNALQETPAPEASPEEEPQGNPVAAQNEQLSGTVEASEPEKPDYSQGLEAFSLSAVPEYSGKAYTEIHGGKPFFDPDGFDDRPFEFYPALDDLGRCGTTMACVGKELMPTEERGQIGMIKPSGWHTIRYDDLIEDRYLYNRCHLIGYQLTSENANERNLVTGTRYLNTQGMLPIENKVAEYIRKTGNHVLYRVTPAFDGEDLLAKGILIEARSVEDAGAGICLCLFAYNVQPGVVIDYVTGDSWRANPEQAVEQATRGYIGNKKSMVFHLPSCPNLPAEKNRIYFETREEAVENGYHACGNCHP